MPFPGTKIIPTGWSRHHQPIVEGAFNAAVTITDPSRTAPGTWDEDSGTYTDDTPHFVVGGPEDTRPEWRDGVPCRIQRLLDDRVVDHAEQDVTVRGYLIQLPADVPDIETGYVAEVVSCMNDPHFVGETLTAIDVFHGSERFNRDVVWTHNQAPRTPEDA